MDFEASIKRLEEINRQLSSSETTLEESLKLFSEGVKLVEKSQKELTKARLKVEELTLPKEG